MTPLPLRVEPCDADGLALAQRLVAAHHYLRAPVDPRCRTLAYAVYLGDRHVGCLIVGRPEATRCYRGGLTYGSQTDVQAGRAQFDRWCVLNLARVWLDPLVQPGGGLYGPGILPGFVDRRGVWRSSLASTAIRAMLARVGVDYLAAHPPVDCAYPYTIQAVLSYCDRSKHRGVIYRAAGFQIARTNERGIETWWSDAVAPLTFEQDAAIRRLSEITPRSQRIRARRGQMELTL